MTELENEKFKDIMKEIDVGIYIINKERKIIFWNKGSEKITGYLSEEVLNHSCSENILRHIDEEGNELCIGLCPASFTIEDGRERSSKVFLHHKLGHRVPVQVQLTSLRDDNNNIIGAVETFWDISEQNFLKREYDKLKNLSNLDTLTGIPNRRFIENKISEVIEEYKKTEIPFGFYFIDVDNFKHYNDDYDHLFGDEVLKMIAKNLAINTRNTDYIGRWGGDEFIAIIRFVNKEQFLNIGERFRITTKNSFLVRNEERITASISIGGTMITKEDTAETLTKRADEALYNSKQNGKNFITII